jgi:hypothetical protein
MCVPGAAPAYMTVYLVCVLCMELVRNSSSAMHSLRCPWWNRWRLCFKCLWKLGWYTRSGMSSVSSRGIVVFIS